MKYAKRRNPFTNTFKHKKILKIYAEIKNYKNITDDLLDCSKFLHYYWKSKSKV